MNIDPRGVKRGKCLTENCDCTVYEFYKFSKESCAKCCYCFCPPTKHEKLDVTEVATAQVSSQENVRIILPSSATQEDITYSVLDLVPAIDFPVQSSVIPAVSVISPQLQDLIPKKLPKKVELALANQTLSPLLRNRIVRSIADKCFEGDVKTKTVDEVANLAVQKWSPLKNHYGDNPAASLALQIKRRLSKLRMKEKKKEENANNSKEINNVLIYNQSEMANEREEQGTSLLKLKQFLNDTREKRKEEVNRMSSLDILNMYPALKIPSMLLFEFSKLTNILEDVLFERLKEFLQSMQNYLEKTENFKTENESYESLAVAILKKLPRIVPSGKKTRSATKFVLQIFEDDTQFQLPLITDPPRLIAIADEAKELTFSAYVDGSAIFSEKCPLKAVLMVLAVYWIFNINFSPESRPAFLLLSSAILRAEMPQSRITKNSAVNCLLRQLNLKE